MINFSINNSSGFLLIDVMQAALKIMCGYLSGNMNIVIRLKRIAIFFYVS